MINTVLTYLLSCTVSKLWLIICQIFASERECLTLSLSLGWSPASIAINNISLKTTLFGLHFCRWKYLYIFMEVWFCSISRFSSMYLFCSNRRIINVSMMMMMTRRVAHDRLGGGDRVMVDLSTGLPGRLDFNTHTRSILTKKPVGIPTESPYPHNRRTACLFF